MNAERIAKDLRRQREAPAVQPDYRSVGVLKPVYDKVKAAAEAEGVPMVKMVSAAAAEGLDAARKTFRRELRP